MLAQGQSHKLALTHYYLKDISSRIAGLWVMITFHSKISRVASNRETRGYFLDQITIVQDVAKSTSLSITGPVRQAGAMAPRDWGNIQLRKTYCYPRMPYGYATPAASSIESQNYEHIKHKVESWFDIVRNMAKVEGIPDIKT